MPASHKESAFETRIEHDLIHHCGYTKLDPTGYDTELGLFPEQVMAFIRETQPTALEPIQKYHGAGTDKAVLHDLTKTLENEGSLSVLRHGFKCFGKRLRLAYFQPVHGMNPEAARLYGLNRLTVTRQLHYSDKTPTKSLDVVLSVNGLPVVTAELKNPLTGQTVEHAKTQYRTDRDPKELIFKFKQRSLVHFAVDPHQVYMATQLAGSSTYFLPFNRGHEQGAGNPPPRGDDYSTSYLWQEVWHKDSLLDILGRFMHLYLDEKRIPTATGVEVKRKEVMIFPRYHQLVVVRKLIEDARRNGPGKNYLIQHSAGSGKSNSIAWLAHRLANLHDDKDQKIFHSVIVITDRRVLDQQLQDTVYQFEHKQGVVEKIDKDTKQLVNALVSGTPIIICTIQKFPFIVEALEKLNKDLTDENEKLQLNFSGKRFAVIVDEAHSSTSGETATELKGILNKETIAKKAKEMAEADEDREDLSVNIYRKMAERGQQENLSFFAFTATPKHKTLGIFGVPGPDGKNEPFHLYSMRQAIEEGFILDVLKHYTTYQQYYGLIKKVEHDPHVRRKKGAKELTRFEKLHPDTIYQKIEIMVEHFRQNTRHRIGGKAKAMVVTDSRLGAVRYKQEFEKYIANAGYTDIKALVAFSGSVDDPDIKDKKYTEVGMNNGISEKALPDKFASDEYQILLVAEKYQTGFDQPLLHTMYVDKRLSGVQAVQTLSRLNRTCAGKEDTFVLDFVNTTEEIYKSFKPYYEVTVPGDNPEYNQLITLKSKLDGFRVYAEKDIEDLCRDYFSDTFKDTEHGHQKLYKHTANAVKNFQDLEKEQQDEFKHSLVAFRNLYSYMSQILPFSDVELEKFYTYSRFLLKQLPRRDDEKGEPVDREVSLKYYRIQKISEGSIILKEGETQPIKGPTDTGTGSNDDEKVKLSELIEILNQRFGTNFTQVDQLFIDQVEETAFNDEKLRMAAHANKEADFMAIFDKAVEGLFLDRMDENEKIVSRILNEDEFKSTIVGHLGYRLYTQIRKKTYPNLGAKASPKQPKS